MRKREQRLLAALLAAAAAGVGLVVGLATRGSEDSGALDPGRALAAEGHTPTEEPAPAPSLAPSAPPQRASVESAGPEAGTAAPPGARPHGTGRILGKVVLEDGSTPAAGVHVVAARGPSEPRVDWVAAAMGATEPSAHAITDSEGEFELSGVDPGQSYSLVIGGLGRVGAQPRWVVRPDRAAQTYPLQRLFGALVRMREPGGGPVRLNAGLSGSRLGRSRHELTEVYPMYGVPAAAVLAGIDPALLEPSTLGERLLLYKSSSSVDELGPIRFEADYPGYEVVALELFARFVVTGPSEHELELVPTVAGFGELWIELRGWSGPCPPIENPGGPALLLRLQSPRGEIFAFEIAEADPERTVVGGLPYGSFATTVMLGSRASRSGGRGAEHTELVIGPAPARALLDLSRSASLAFDVRDADGEPHEGVVSLLYGHEDARTGGWRTQHFLGPPYRVDELEPGTYRIVLQAPFAAGTSADHPLRVPARGGECTRVELRE